MRKSRIDKLVKLLNNNFTNKDLFLVLTYDNEKLPITKEDAREDVLQFFRRVKKYLEINNLPDLKYIAAIECRGRKEMDINLYHHIIMSGDIDRDKVEELWKKGRANADRLNVNKVGYDVLARYITKEFKEYERWIQSNNLSYKI